MILNYYGSLFYCLKFYEKICNLMDTELENLNDIIYDKKYNYDLLDILSC